MTSGAERAGSAGLPLEAEELLSWLAVERGRAPNTLRAYRRDLRAYTGWLAERGDTLAEVSPSTIESYVAHLRTQGRASSSVARAVVAVRSLHRFLTEEGETGTDPAGAVEVPRVPRGLPKALSEEDVSRLIASVSGQDPVARRDRAMLEVLYGTGVRISELVGLSRPDVDLEGGLARVTGKGSKERLVPLAGLTHRALADWLSPSGRGALTAGRPAPRRDADAVFVNARGGRLSRQGAWGIVAGRGRRIGLGGRLSPHVLRHSCATHMLDHGADIRVVQELLGHVSITTTQVYTYVSNEALRRAYERAHPRARGRAARRPGGGSLP